MKITLLGTGANECIPAFRCTCPVCTNSRKIGGREIRQNSSALLEIETGKSLLLDMPPQITSLLSVSGIDTSSIHDILFTHSHEDHILGARHLFQGSSRKGFEFKNKANVYMPETAFTSMSGKFLYGKTSSKLAINTENYEVHIIKAYNSYSVAGMKVTPLETNHLHESFGYLLESEKGKTMVYLVDAAKRLPEKTIVKLSEKPIDLLIVDCTFKETDSNEGHSDIEAAIELNNGLKPVRMVLSHIGHKNLTHQELVSTMSSYNIDVGFDSMIIHM